VLDFTHYVLYVAIRGLWLDGKGGRGSCLEAAIRKIFYTSNALGRRREESGIPERGTYRLMWQEMEKCYGEPKRARN